MILHVENLRRVYTKEHAELLELRETLMQNERSFGSHTERGIKKIENKSFYFKPASKYDHEAAAICFFYSFQMIFATRSSRRHNTTR